MSALEPVYGCDLCPRLRGFLEENKQKHPTFFNGPVPSFGPLDAGLFIVGLAPGLKGANQTSRPFTGDYAGDLLYGTLSKYGLSEGTFAGHKDDGLTLKNCRITNAVRCVPPQNKPLPVEIKTCNPFLKAQLTQMPKLKVILALGRVAHESILYALGLRQKDYPFGHHQQHALTIEGRTVWLIDSYHCSRYNTQTKRLTETMFHDVFESISQKLA